MSVDVKISLDGRSMAYISRLKQAPAAARRELLRTIDRENQVTVGQIQQRRLSRRGPDTLGVITNRLRGSINATKAQLGSDGGIYSGMGTNVVYGGIHEFGFQGGVTVRAHTRRIHEFVEGTAQPAIFNPKSGKIAPANRGVRVETGTVQVRSHTRNIKVPARAYIRRTIEERVGAYQVAISSTVTRLMQN